MVKKIILGILFVGLSGLLVFGAVNRTIAKSAAHPESNEPQPLTLERSPQQLNQDLKNNGGRGFETDADRSLQNLPGQTGSGDGMGVPMPQTIVGTWEIIEGKVDRILSDSMVVRVDDGREIVVEGRAWVYAVEQNYIPPVGNVVRLEGYFEECDGEEEVFEFKTAMISDLTSGESIVLRDQNGRPMWAGDGWGGGRATSEG